MYAEQVKGYIAASDPLFGFFLFTSLHLLWAWPKLFAVIIPFPIGLLNEIERLKIASNVDLQIKSKCGVFPFITQPNTTNASNFFMFFLNAIGISKIPETFKILRLYFFFL